MEYSSQEAKFNVILDVYEGPFDLLLAIIQKNQLDISEVPIARITSDFLEYINVKDKKLDDISSFLLIAAILMNIKADALLPKAQEEEDYGIELESLDPSIELAASLIEYKKFKNVALELQMKFQTEERYYAGRVPVELIQRPNLNFLENVDVISLTGIYAEALLRASKEVETDHLVGSSVSIEDKIEYILRHLNASDSSKHNFSSLIRDCTSRIEKIVTFLALLELHKAGTIKLSQKVNFGEIDIVPVKTSLA